MIPDIAFEIMPAFGFLLCASGFGYISLMYNECKGAYAMIYGNFLLDTILGISIIYGGVHGVLVLIYGNAMHQVQPIVCIVHALHNSIWSYTDSGHEILLLIICIDQFASVILSKTHDKWSNKFCQSGILVFVLIVSGFLLTPTWRHSFKNAKNDTITINPLCLYEEFVDDSIYNILIEIRKWVPVTCIIILAYTSILILIFQLRDGWNFKWTDNNEHAQKLFMYAIMRCFMEGLSAHVPVLLYSNVLYYRKKEPGVNELLYRLTQSVFYGIIQPACVFYLVPKYYKNLWIFFNKYAHNTKRTWQSADDPPTEKHHNHGSNDGFGSWYSTTGNIVGEAGIPYETSKEQRSVSFYYDD